jgi:hypothetical protein
MEGESYAELTKDLMNANEEAAKETKMYGRKTEEKGESY